MTKPLILVSNDDGYYSMGIHALARALCVIGEVVVVAPATDQSAISHAISLNRPLRLQQKASLHESGQEVLFYSVDGTPTDSVYMGVHHVLKGRKPDLMVSGINHGANLGYDILYSGTVSAAMEAAMLGVTSVAVSLVSLHDYNFDMAAEFCREFCKGIIKKTWPTGTLFNVNVPKRLNSLDYAVTRLGHHEYTTEVAERKDPRGNSYYWIGGTWSGYQDLPGTDCRAIAQELISVTPITLNLTYAPLLGELMKVESSLKAIPLFTEET
ncbi:MAG: 5'/3'-nucleotidase SurE [Myxococcales bacterium]|nr:5'/3'-nucleotidase SurE [Myxococcales bacterium]USN50349.1 MAG: 5'/3'-nucleotidase SurE [Myxococcales bacterium]